VVDLGREVEHDRPSVVLPDPQRKHAGRSAVRGRGVAGETAVGDEGTSDHGGTRPARAGGDASDVRGLEPVGDAGRGRRCGSVWAGVGGAVGGWDTRSERGMREGMCGVVAGGWRCVLLGCGFDCVGVPWELAIGMVGGGGLLRSLGW
jgi:hypothetical protein